MLYFPRFRPKIGAPQKRPFLPPPIPSPPWRPLTKGWFQEGGFGRCTFTPEKCKGTSAKCNLTLEKGKSTWRMYLYPKRNFQKGVKAHSPKPPLYKTLLFCDASILEGPRFASANSGDSHELIHANRTFARKTQSCELERFAHIGFSSRFATLSSTDLRKTGQPPRSLFGNQTRYSQRRGPEFLANWFAQIGHLNFDWFQKVSWDVSFGVSEWVWSA